MVAFTNIIHPVIIISICRYTFWFRVVGNTKAGVNYNDSIKKIATFQTVSSDADSSVIFATVPYLFCNDNLCRWSTFGASMIT